MNMSRVDPSEQIRYVQCGVCSTILLVNVPYNNLSMVVSVRCGNCTCLLSVNMAISSFIPLHLLTSLTHNLSQPKEGFQETEIQQNTSDQLIHTTNNIIPFSDHHENDADAIVVPPIPFVNKPPEKKQRAPSAYNQFIKEEIRRLKSENPRMPHKEAFKTAAKNWAHLPPIHCHAEGERSGRISSKHRPQNHEAVTKPTLN